MITHISHTDLDGYGCRAIIETFHPDINFINIDYYDIKKVLNEENLGDTLIITDLNFSADELQILLGMDKKILYIDHHDYNEETQNVLGQLKEKNNTKIVWNKEWCATMLTYGVYKNRFKKLLDQDLVNNLKHFINLVDVYDMWRVEHKNWDKAFMLNDMFRYFGYDKAYLMLKENKFKIPDEWHTIYKNILKERDDYFTNLKNNDRIIIDEDNRIGLFILDNAKFSSHITFLYDLDHYILFYPFGSLSIRHKINDEKFLKTFLRYFEKLGEKYNITSGGHLKAQGASLNNLSEEQRYEIVEKILKTIEKLKRM